MVIISLIFLKNQTRPITNLARAAERFGKGEKIEEFKPKFVLFSAGFDAHEDDPLAQFNLKTEDYYTITKRILKISKKFCHGKVVSILEGGYDLKALQDSTKRHVDALLAFN